MLGHFAPMRLGIVFNQFEMMALADVGDTFGVGTNAIEVDQHQGTGAGSDGLLYAAVINLSGVEARLYEHGLQSTLSDSENAGDVGVGGNDDLIARLHHAHLYVGPEDEREGIKPIAARHAMAGANELGIVLLKATGGLALQIPPAVEHLANGGAQLGIVVLVDTFQVEIFHHSMSNVQRSMFNVHSVHSYVS